MKNLADKHAELEVLPVAPKKKEEKEEEKKSKK